MTTLWCLLVSAGLFALVEAELLPADTFEGCTDDCRPIVRADLPCRDGFSCSVSHLRHWLHVIPNCALTTCAAGLLYVGEEYADVGLLVCRDGEWFARDKKFGHSPKVSCANAADGCAACPSARLTKKCPAGYTCTPSLLSERDRDTGCAVIKCAGGAKLFALVGGKKWLSGDFADCLHNRFWRLGGLRAWDGPYEFTCARAPTAQQLAGMIAHGKVASALKNPGVVELLKNTDLLRKVLKEEEMLLPIASVEDKAASLLMVGGGGKNETTATIHEKILEGNGTAVAVEKKKSG